MLLEFQVGIEYFQFRRWMSFWPVKKGRVSLLAEPRIHLAFAGQDASGYPSGMTVSWFTRLAGTRRMSQMRNFSKDL